MEKTIGRYFIENSLIKEMSTFPETQENTTIIYEVVRLIENIPLFFEEHYNRIINSVYLAKYELNDLPNMETTRNAFNLLIKENNISLGNIKLGFMFINKTFLSFKIYFIPHSYPTIYDYEDGVKLMSFKAIRKQPNIKIRNRSLREKSNEFIKQHNIFEVLLINDDNLITEGSRSNIFFIKDELVYSPKNEHILKGITWQYVVKICKNKGINITEQDINLNNLSDYESCFITGTSPKIIPVKKINDVKFIAHNYITNIIKNEYEQIILKYIENYTK